MSKWIQTYTGKAFNLSYITADQFDIVDIAHALSNLCRYTGHTKEFYSVAQHCVHAYDIAPKRLKKTALLHEVSEAYLGDISSPLKALLPDYRRLEDRIMLHASFKFNFFYGFPEEIKEIDRRLLQTEKNQLMQKEPKAWDISAEPYDLQIVGWSNLHAENEFLTRCKMEDLL